ncbi:MAG: DUF4832 domain-containing protein [Bacteroidota bacterium]
MLGRTILIFALLSGIFLEYSHISGQSTTVNYLVSDEDMPNPERGFYRYSITFANSYTPLNQAVLEGYRSPQVPDTANHEVVSTLVFRYFVLEGFTEMALPNSLLNSIANDFAIARQAGVKLIPRFSYTNVTDPSTCSSTVACPPYGDAEKSVVLGHIGQLTPILQANADVIATLQMGFIGIFGEGYYTDHFGDASHDTIGNGFLTDQNWLDRAEVLSATLGALPDTRMVQVRYPQKKQRFLGGVNAPTSFPPTDPLDAYSGSDASRIGFHNDCLLASFTDFGTYFDYGNTASGVALEDTANLKPYVAADSRFVVVGGETCSDGYDPQNNCSGTDPLAFGDAELERMHYSYLNADFNLDVNNDWQDGGCMDNIKRRLGYRFELNTGTFSSVGRPGGVVNFSLQIRNVGYAAPFNPRRVDVVLRNMASGQRFYAYLNDDPRLWEPGTTATLDYEFCLPASMPTGIYEWLLSLPDPETNLEDDPDYSIQLASRLPGGQSVWESSTGYNLLGGNLNVTMSGPGNACTDEITFTTEDSPLPVSWMGVSARGVKDHIVVEWSTEWESDNYGFEVERSRNGTDFRTLGFVTPSESRTYRFIDETPEPGVVYFYRIRQIDFDGANSISPVVRAEISGVVSDLEVVVFPNPSNGQINLAYPDEWNDARLEVYDAFGRQVLEQTLSPSLDLSSQPTGVYYLSIRSARQDYSIRIVLE